MSLFVRRAVPEDAAALAAVEVASSRAAYRDLMPAAFLAGLSIEEKAQNWRQDFARHTPSGRERVTVAVGEAGIVGFVSVGPVPEEAEAGIVYLLYVMPEHWGGGVGKALMNTAMADFRDMGMSEAVLWVFRDNHRARRFYEKFGWQADGQTSTRDYGGVTLEALCYRRAVET